VLLVKFKVSTAVTMKNAVFMIHHLVLVRTDVSVEITTSIIRMTRISELGTTISLTSNRRKQRRNAIIHSYC
jgi:hypothetical protein